MKKQIMQIAGCPVIAKEMNGQRVLLTSDIASLHKVADNTIRQNFKRHRKMFVEGVDYILDKVSQPVSDNLSLQRLYFTESGYLMLVKSLQGDLAWQMQRELVNSYFKLGKLEMMIRFMDVETRKLLYYRGLGLTQRETAKLLDISKDKVQLIEKNLKSLGYVAPSVGRREI